ncbi:MAG: sugar-binding transcriptional regulator [Spirochaetota bacterium]
MPIVDDNLLISIAKLYYVEGLSQQEIADRISVSRPTVSNLLKRCKEEGIVEIRIKETNSLLYVLQRELKAVFGLRDVVVVPSGPDEAVTIEETGRAASEQLARSLKDGMRIGISWGATTYKSILALNVAPKYQKIEVRQLVGALGSINPIHDGYELVRMLAQKLNGSYTTIQAPGVVSSVEAKDFFLREPGIATAIDKAREVDLAILSVSPDDPDHSSLVRAGFITREESTEINRQGAVGHSCGIHFDIDGRIFATLLNDRIVGITVEDLRRIPTVILAACGAVKADAILGALRSGLFHILATDEAAALKILAETKKDGVKPANG